MFVSCQKQEKYFILPSRKVIGGEEVGVFFFVLFFLLIKLGK